MKTHPFSTLFLTALASACLPALALAQGSSTLHLDATMQNVHWTPAAGSINWLSNWQLETSAAGFDTASGHSHDYRSLAWTPGVPTNIAATAGTTYSSAAASVGVDAAGMGLTLGSSFTINSPPGLAGASANSSASAYRDFQLTGGSGTVDLTLSFDYFAHLLGTSSGSSLEYSAGLRLTDGSTIWDLVAYAQRSTPVDQTVNGTLSRTFSLQYGTPYSVSFFKDTEVPEPSCSVLLATGLILLLTRRACRNGSPFQTTSIPSEN